MDNSGDRKICSKGNKWRGKKILLFTISGTKK